MLIRGRCHCGNIRFALNWDPDPAEIPARACGCSFCRQHGGVWTSCPTGDLVVHIAVPEKLNRYNFGTRTADFLVCGTCGVVPVVLSEIGAITYAVVNVNTFEVIDPSMLKHAPVSFEGEDEETRLTRRAKGWIPRVALRAAGDA